MPTAEEQVREVLKTCPAIIREGMEASLLELARAVDRHAALEAAAEAAGKARQAASDREVGRLHRDLDAAAKRLVVLEAERDAARANFTGSIAERDRLRMANDRYVAELRTESAIRSAVEERLKATQEALERSREEHGKDVADVNLLRAEKAEALLAAERQKERADTWTHRAGEAALQLANVVRALEGVPLHAPAGAEAVAVIALRDEAGRLRDALAAEQKAARALSDELAALKAGEDAAPESPPCPLYQDDAMATCGDAVLGRKPGPEDVCAQAEECHAVLVAKAPALVQLALLASPA